MDTSAVPGPRSPRLMQGFAYFRKPLALLDDCAKRFGNCFTLRVPTLPDMVYVSDPDVISEIFARDGTDAIETGSIFASVMAPVVGAHSMLVIDGDEHKRHRGATMPYFARGQFARLGDAIIELADREIATWPNDVVFAMRPKMQNITLQVMLRILFGDRSQSVFTQDLLRRAFGVGPNPFIFYRWGRVDLGPRSPWGGFLRIRREITDAIIAEIRRRRADDQQSSEDVLGSMMKTRGDDGATMSDEELIDETWTLINAGNDTTATALAWAIYHVVRHPEVLAELRREVSALSRPTAQQLAQLPYLDATVREVLRISPIFLFVGRRLKEPMRVGDRELPAGATVAPCIYLAHRRPDIWKDPERFNPRRFLDQRYPAHQYFPFGGGIRHCIGAALAIYEMKLVLARVFARVDLHLKPGYVAKPRWYFNFIAPSDELPVVARSISSSN